LSARLISLNPDLTRLRRDGYDIRVRKGYLVVLNVPYVAAGRVVKLGTIGCALDLAGDVTKQPSEHWVVFAGDQPCDAAGKPLDRTLLAGGANADLGDGIIARHTLSSKPLPSGRYDDYHHKIKQYAGILAGYAVQIDPSVTATPFNPVPPDIEDETVFNYVDTASSRAEITALTPKLQVGKIAIVGCGGSGSYILDYLSKTEIREIHLFDGDVQRQHNAFRTPGAMTREELTGGPYKVDYLAGMYAPLRRAIVPHHTYIDESNVDELRGMDFIFIAVDRTPARMLITANLAEFGVPFADVGMGLELVGDALIGQIRTTVSTPSNREWAEKRMPLAGDGGEDDYQRNIQVVELNAINAALAVMAWKKLVGFYAHPDGEMHSVLQVDGGVIITETPG
jgi:ThiF family